MTLTSSPTAKPPTSLPTASTGARCRPTGRTGAPQDAVRGFAPPTKDGDRPLKPRRSLSERWTASAPKPSSISDWTADPFLAGCSGRKGCRVAGGERHHVVEHQVGDIWRHQRAPWTGPRAVLKIVELPHEVARRP